MKTERLQCDKRKKSRSNDRLLCFNYVLVVLVLLCIACSDCLANKESGNGENQNYNYEDDMRYPISGQVHTEESHGGQQMSSAVAPEEVEALLGGNDEAEQRKQVNNNESNNAAPVSVVAKPHCKANHAKDDKNGTYNIVPAKVLTNKLEGANLFKAETIAKFLPVFDNLQRAMAQAEEFVRLKHKLVGLN